MDAPRPVDLGPRATSLYKVLEAKSMAYAVCHRPGTQEPEAKCTLQKVKRCQGVSPWARLPASPDIALAATGKVVVAALTCPILGRAIGPITPYPIPEVLVAAHAAGPIFVVRLPPPILLPLPLCATTAPLREAQVHGTARFASPAIPLHPLVNVRLRSVLRAR